MFILPVYYSYGQDSVVMNLKKHIYYLSSDKLQGRLTGSKGEKKASAYIIRQYKDIGIVPRGFQGSFLQTFSIRSGKKPVGKNQLVINTHKLTLNQDYYPLNASSDGKIKGSVADVGYGIAAPAINYDSYKSQIDLKGKIFLMEAGTPDGQDPHSKYGPYADVKSKVEAAVAKGAIGIIFTNSNDQSEEPDPSLNIRSFEATIPVIFIKSNALKEARRDQLNVAEITVHLEKISVTGHNVIGFLDNHAPATIVIGAHYDHLGRNELGGSLFRGEPEIHNGADDNASGTAGVIELARWLASNGTTEKNNFLFINFSGEEEGLHGSKSWLSHATYDTSKINFMINMDMIGRYGSEKGLQIDGLGTSPDAFGFIRTTSFDSLKLRFSDNGIGPSDHTSFYLENIPVLFFFTGYQEDYHKPTDDADKINYSGERDILRLIQHLIMELDKKGTLRFSKTKSTGNEEIPQFKVRLGIVPDYSFEGNGLRVDGVNEGEPASKAGILKGDVIISLGDYTVTDIYAYMHALAAHKKGDTAPVKILRNSQEIQLKVTF
ncbi:MAG: M20/M25/M40 family metallo-hydrolase [Chitinophagales bacterium]